MSVRPPASDEKRARAHGDSVRSDTAEITRFLLELFGPQLVAHMAGVADHKRVHKWAKGDGMGRAAETRLRAAYQIAWLLLEHDAAETVRAWFIGMNPQLDYEAPATAIRDDHAQHAMVAAEAFLSGA